MKKPLPSSIANLLNGAAVLPPVTPVEIYDIEIPTRAPDEKSRQDRFFWRTEARNKRVRESGADYDLPF